MEMTMVGPHSRKPGTRGRGTTDGSGGQAAIDGSRAAERAKAERAKAERAKAERAKAERIMAELDRLYPSPPIPLRHRDPFTLLVAVMLSAQTTDKKVNEVTPALFRAAGDARAMAALSVEEILGHIRQLGLAPTKAKNLKATCHLLVERHGGKVPANLEALEALPGVGHKTAQVVMAQAFGVPSFPVDTHIHRLAARWGLSSGKNVATTERDLKRIFPESRWNRLHLQIIYCGREHCPARGHDPGACPICRWASPEGVAAAAEPGAGPRAPRRTQGGEKAGKGKPGTAAARAKGSRRGRGSPAAKPSASPRRG